MKLKVTPYAAGQLYTRLHLLSLDIVAGALAGAAMAVKITGSSPGWPFWYVLAASVWLVYNTDHFLDGLKTGVSASNPRHLFHFMHGGQIALSILIIGTVTAFIAFIFLPKILIKFGVILGGIILLYLALAYFAGRYKKQHLHKEYIIALIYIAGIWAGPFLLSHYYSIEFIWILMGVNFLLALVNLLTLSYFDLETDLHDGDTSFAVVYGRKATKISIYSLIFIALTLSGIIFIVNNDVNVRKAAVIFSGMALVQFIIFYFRRFFRENNRFRTFGELVFIMPAIIFI